MTSELKDRVSSLIIIYFSDILTKRLWNGCILRMYRAPTARGLQVWLSLSDSYNASNLASLLSGLHSKGARKTLQNVQCRSFILRFRHNINKQATRRIVSWIELNKMSHANMIII